VPAPPRLRLVYAKSKTKLLAFVAGPVVIVQLLMGVPMEAPKTVTFEMARDPSVHSVPDWLKVAPFDSVAGPMMVIPGVQGTAKTNSLHVSINAGTSTHTKIRLHFKSPL
jgi:hypothetical protein